MRFIAGFVPGKFLSGKTLTGKNVGGLVGKGKKRGSGGWKPRNGGRRPEWLQAVSEMFWNVVLLSADFGKTLTIIQPAPGRSRHMRN